MTSEPVTSHSPSRSMSRRRLLEAMLAAPASAMVIAACGSGSTEAGTTAGSSTTASNATTASTASSGAASGSASSGSAATAGGWASGGTDLISVAYPDTTLFDALDPCVMSLTESTTEGPCYFAVDTGEDISQGHSGLPMQLCLQLRDPDCNPLEGYVIEVWHCDTEGVYSGDTSASSDSSSFAGDFCTAGDDEAEASTWYRGQRTTDAEGRVNFKTCFPGWYGGRTIHIHFAVTDPDGTTRLISQFCFTDELAADICTTHDLYSDRGEQDTPLAGGTDTVFPADGYEDFLMTTQANDDGSLLGYAVVQIDPDAVATGGGADGGPGRRP